MYIYIMPTFVSKLLNPSKYSSVKTLNCFFKEQTTINIYAYVIV